MIDPFLGEIRLFAGGYAPDGWALCDGQLLPIQSNTALFSLIATTYGGDGVTNFALPDLRSRVPVHMGTLATGTIYALASTGGTETETVSLGEMPSHSHSLRATMKPGIASSPAGSIPATSTDVSPYSAVINTSMNPTMLATVGANQPHDNMLPYLPINFIIALTGTIPSPR